MVACRTAVSPTPVCSTMRRKRSCSKFWLSATPTVKVVTPASSRPVIAPDAAPIAVIELVDRDVAAKGQDSGPVLTADEDEPKPPDRRTSPL
jgi:hypothetical protein